MNRRKRRNFFQKHLWTILSATLLLLAILAFQGYKGFKANEITQEHQRVQTKLWPPLKTGLEQDIQTFDQQISVAGATEASLNHLNLTLERLRSFRKEHKGVFLKGAGELEEQINSRRELHSSELWWKQSIEAERTAINLKSKSLGESSQISDALERMKLALELQQKINDEFPENSRANFARTADMQSWIHTIEAEPLDIKRQQAIQRAESASANRDWDTAKTLLTTAIELQSEINHQFPDAPQSDFTEIVRLEEKVRECEAQLLFEKSEDAVVKADTYFEADKEQMALEYLSTALDLQNDINLNYSSSTVFSYDRADTIAERIQTVMAKSVVEKIYKLDEELNLLLSVDMMEEIAFKLGDLEALFRKLEQDYPLYPSPPIELKEKTMFLQDNFDKLPQILSLFNNLTTQDVKTSGSMVTVTELIPQNLYQLVQHTNPSRNQQETLPVESVSYDEALLFCKRLSYLLAESVVLPDLEMLKQIASQRKTEIGQIEREWSRSPELSTEQKARLFSRSSPDSNPEEKDIFFRSRSVGFRVARVIK